MESAQVLVALEPMNLRTDEELWVRYDYLLGANRPPAYVAPEVPLAATFPNTATRGEQQTNSPITNFATPPAAGSSVILFYRAKFGGACSSITGLGATWTSVAQNASGGISVWVGTGCNGTGTLVTLTSDHVMGITAIEVTTPLKTSGVIYQTGNALGHKITTPLAGVGFYTSYSGSGRINTPPESAWWTPPEVHQTAERGVVAVTAGAEVGRECTSTPNFLYVVVGVVPYA